MAETPKRSKHAATPAPKMPPAPPAGNTELSEEELGKVSGGIALENERQWNEPKMPAVKSIIIPKVDATLP